MLPPAPRARLAPWIACAGAGLASVLAWDADAAVTYPLIVIESETVGCPSPEEAAAELRRLLPAAQVVTVAPASGDAAPAPIHMEIVDLGASYRLRTSSGDREIREPARRCAERARAAAVFLAVRVVPREAGDNAALGAPTRSIPDDIAGRLTVAGAAGGQPTRWSINVDAGGIASVAPTIADAGTAWTGGGLVRVDLMTTHFGVALGVSGLSPATLSPMAIRMVRVPFDLDARLALRRGRFETLGDVGLMAAVMTIDTPTHGGTRLDAGVRAAVQFRVWLHDRLALFASLEAELIPRPYRLLVGDAVVGGTPPLWLGLAVGLTARAR